MFTPRLLILFLTVAVPASVHAEVEAQDVPGQADWYLHADLEAMRNAPSGHALYQWLSEEPFAEVRQELGIDIDEEVDSVTAFADPALGTVLIVEGPISDASRDKLLAIAAVKSSLDAQTYDGKAYYHLQRTGEQGERNGRHGKGRRSLEGFEESAWVTFDVEDKLIVTSTREQLEALIDAGGRLAGAGSHAGSLLLLTAETEFVQAGAHTAELDAEDGWQSNIIRNTEKVALLVSDRDGLIAVSAQLVSTDPVVARSLGGIINGLVGLQSLNDEIDPEIRAMIRNTQIEVTDNLLTIDTVFDPDIVARVLGEDSDGTE